MTTATTSRKHSEINWARLVDLGLKLVGKPYKFGSEVDLKNPDPEAIKAIDCSELVEWLYAQIGLNIPDGSYNQAKLAKHVSREKLLLGDLGFKHYPDTGVIHHVGIYLGEQLAKPGDTFKAPVVLEAKGLSWGTVLTPVNDYAGSSHFAFWGRHPSIQDA